MAQPQQSQALQDTVRFFELLFRPLLQEIQQQTADALQDLQFESKQVFDVSEVQEKLSQLGQGFQQLATQVQQRISQLAGSLALQLVDQAGAQGAEISPILNSLEEESKMKLFAKGKDQSGGGASLMNKNLIDQTEKIQKLEKELKEREQECKELQNLLAERVDRAPQYQNLVKMLKKKTEEIEELRGGKM